MGLALEVRDAVLTYRQAPGAPPVVALSLPHFTLASGDVVGVTGPSGSGKTSLLAVLAALERPDTGRVVWGDQDVASLGEAERDRWRRLRVGFVFQEFNLLAGLSALQNVLLPATFVAFRIPASLRERAATLLARVGLGDVERGAASLSRGEMQRVALARALLFAPPILLADEPTASLDAASGLTVADLLLELARDTGSTLVVVTHDPTLLDRLPRVERLVQGRFVGARRDEPASAAGPSDEDGAARLTGARGAR
jgi:putative ABC transport system ATP-binding protein